ncbi:MAG: peptidylprolyl isomerase [Alphaproteobacteria bacterium]
MSQRATIKVNERVLPPQMIAAEAQHHPAKTPGAAYREATRALIVRTLLLEEAIRLGISAEPQEVLPGKRETEDEARIRALTEAAVPQCEPSEADCRAYYEANAERRFRAPDLFEASHILFAADPGDTEARASANERAAATLMDLVQAPHRFAELARERSDCESRASGGHLGQMSRTDLVKEIAEALDELDEGEISAPVSSRFGVHLLRLDRVVQGEVLPFDYVKDHIHNYLRELTWRRNAAAYVGKLIAEARIEGIELEGTTK